MLNDEGILMKIIEGIHQVDGVTGNVYLVKDYNKLILIDTGLPRSDGKILKYVHSIGQTPSDVSTIILTHFHIDHVGSALKLKSQTNAKIAVHEKEADVIAGKKAQPKLKNVLFRTLSSMAKAAPIEPDLLLKNNDKVGRLTVVHTPGHSEGSMSLLDVERKVIFVGDALRFTDGKIESPPERFTLNPDTAKESIGLISTFDFDVLLCGHGDPLMPSASEKIKDFYASINKKN